MDENNTSSAVMEWPFKTADEKQEGQTQSGEVQEAPVSISLRPLE